MNWQYFHRVSERVSWIDHKIHPDIRSMFGAMSSRAPAGGIEARYREICLAIAKVEHQEAQDTDNSGLAGERKIKPWGYYAKNADWVESQLRRAERALTSSALPKIVRNRDFDPNTFDRATGFDASGERPGFFDTFVLMYGHSSIMELTGNILIVEHISMWCAFNTFSASPLVAGQEMSTRAIYRGLDWKTAFDLALPLETPHYVKEGWLKMKKMGLEMSRHEVLWWKKFYSEEANRKGHGITDKEAFRPAFDRARWTLPGMVETGFAHSANLRVMARVVKHLEDCAVAYGQTSLLELVAEIKVAYAQMLPGTAGMGLREAVSDQHEAVLPGHLNFLTIHEDGSSQMCEDVGLAEDFGRDVLLQLHPLRRAVDLKRANPHGRSSRRAYVDPYFNHFARVDWTIRCSWAAARDFNRHRTSWPIRYRLIQDHKNNFVLDHHYEPKSNFAKEHFAEYFALASVLFSYFIEQGNQWMAMACVPFGARVELTGQCGLRDALYTFELRGYAAGANFEYREQARDVLGKLEEKLKRLDSSTHPGIFDKLGLQYEIGSS